MPRSISCKISAGAFVRGRAMGVRPTASAAKVSASAASSVMLPCSQSMSIQSNPKCPTISTM